MATLGGSALSLFPQWVAFVDPRTGMLTPEGFRSLQAMFKRVGGTLGDMGTDTFAPFVGAVESTGADLVIQQPAQVDVIPESITQPSQTNEAIKVGQYIFRNDLQDPAVVYGYGTWTQIGGGFPAAYLAGDPDFGTMGATGGARTATVDPHDDHTHQFDDNVSASVDGYTAGGVPAVDSVTNGTGNTTGTVDPASALDHEPIDILPPYLVVAVWLRTA